MSHLRYAVLALLSLSSCSDGSDPGTSADSYPGSTQGQGRPLVVTTFYPTEYLVERLAGDWVEVRCDVPADADALFWSPNDAEVAAYQDAALVVLNGAGMDQWIERVSLPLAKIVDTTQHFEGRFVTFESSTHSHGGGDEHTHEGIDPHTWVDPTNVRLQAEEIHGALVRVLPDHEGELDARFEVLGGELSALADEYEALGAVPEGESLYASHPAYNYLVQRYGWPMVNLDLDPESELGGATLESLRERLAEQPARFLLWEGTPIEANSQIVASELGLTSIVISPCELLGPAERAEGVDFLSTLRANLEALRPAFQVP